MKFIHLALVTFIVTLSFVHAEAQLINTSLTLTVRDELGNTVSGVEVRQELIRLLETGWSAEAFQFLASNPVDDPALFYEPVRKGVFQQSLLIRESIQRASHSSHFYPGLFLWEVERVIRSVDRFKGHGTDYLPAMKELRAALDEPSDFKEVTFDCLAPLDKWIRSNQ